MHPKRELTRRNPVIKHVPDEARSEAEAMDISYEVESWRGRWYYKLGSEYRGGYTRRTAAFEAADEEISGAGHVPVRPDPDGDGDSATSANKERPR